MVQIFLNEKRGNAIDHLGVTSLHVSKCHFWVDGMAARHAENLQVGVFIPFIHLQTHTQWSGTWLRDVGHIAAGQHVTHTPSPPRPAEPPAALLWQWCPPARGSAAPSRWGAAGRSAGPAWSAPAVSCRAPRRCRGSAATAGCAAGGSRRCGCEWVIAPIREAAWPKTVLFVCWCRLWWNVQTHHRVEFCLSAKLKEGYVDWKSVPKSLATRKHKTRTELTKCTNVHDWSRWRPDRCRQSH